MNTLKSWKEGPNPELSAAVVGCLCRLRTLQTQTLKLIIFEYRYYGVLWVIKGYYGLLRGITDTSPPQAADIDSVGRQPT